MTHPLKYYFFQQPLLTVIRFYQKTLSPDHGWFRSRYPYGFCRFYPSCSQYTYEAIVKHGSVRGLLLGFRRIGRCNPWTASRIDRVPEISH